MDGKKPLMTITIYKNRKYLSYSFKEKELDKIRQICYDIGIKYYVINYNRSE
jgi:tRNA U34 2-thiouridine synthase MnmA/TrmU